MSQMSWCPTATRCAQQSSLFVLFHALGSAPVSFIKCPSSFPCNQKKVHFSTWPQANGDCINFGRNSHLALGKEDAAHVEATAAVLAINAHTGCRAADSARLHIPRDEKLISKKAFTSPSELLSDVGKLIRDKCTGSSFSPCRSNLT